MLTYYQEITLLPEEEIPVSFLMSKVFLQLHLGIASQMTDVDTSKIGISFPQYRNEADGWDLGTKIRVFASSEEELRQLNLKRLLHRYQDYVHCIKPRKIPERQIHGYAIYSRYHQESSIAQKARRYAKRHGGSETDAAELFSATDWREMPTLKLTSLSNQHTYWICVDKREVESDTEEHQFNSFGLSNLSAVPEF